MLDTDTKRRIDTARDILVGKVPDPKFFAGEFGRYGWAKLMRSGLGGHETLNLYAEAITKMPENPGIPLLFRDIFKNAYLPYRDPETLKMFLKIIDEFNYDHSERLGDAFEYLLSVLGSQGDAGQFRTPRHIIDFMVAIIDPKKTETVLDPACGTAGFLISSYKHILKANTDTKGHSTLTPDEKGRIARNFKGYDISPDRVRLSLVNLYLHGFADPHIAEYDTLTSQDRWNEYADVILANPPFMSPKGGIKPHNRFSVQSKRSEVLFVDYMAEHLMPGGRAGSIVPEGIIFQSQTAYTHLRKMLVEEYLVAVVSLPAGVFNPYSGVKTSILILDKSLARKTNTIAFFKVENDGFGLGAQRREIDKNDLPQADVEIGEYLRRLSGGESVADFQPTLGLIVEKEKIAANGDYNLSGERYREGGLQSTNYPWRKIESLVETITPPVKIQKTAFGETGRFPIIDQSQEDIAGWTDDESALIQPSKPLVVFGDHTCAVKLVETPFAQGADGIKILRTVDTLDPRFLYYLLRTRPLESSGYQRHFSKLKEHEIPLPPLEVQKEIVAEIEGYQKVINGARAVLDHYRAHIPINPDWPTPSFEDAPFKIIDGDRGVNYPKKEDFSPSGYCLFLNTKNVRSDGFNFSEMEFVSKEKDQALRKGKLQRGDVVLTTRGTIGNTGLYDESVEFDNIRINSGMLIFRPDTAKLSGSFLFHFFQSENFRTQRDAIVSGAAQPQLPIRSLNEATIPVPPLATQQVIVAEVEAEQALVAANRELIARFEKKIQATLARVWGEDETAAVET
ncbi:MAG: N-6 DNA methylase [Deltaproteobacteria bacterium]|nr:N-6 DNA methylase [Deltaproteobacteria bacterium]